MLLCVQPRVDNTSVGSNWLKTGLDYTLQGRSRQTFCRVEQVHEHTLIFIEIVHKPGIAAIKRSSTSCTFILQNCPIRAHHSKYGSLFLIGRVWSASTKRIPKCFYHRHSSSHYLSQYLLSPTFLLSLPVLVFIIHSAYVPVSSTNKTDRHDITEILLKVALNIITVIP